MKCILCCILFCSCGTLLLNGQFYFSANNKEEPEWLWEAGLSGGAFNCLTDLGGKAGKGQKFIKDINWGKTRFCGGLFTSFTWHSAISVRLEGTVGNLTASDRVLKNVTGAARSRYLRNLNFNSNIAELTVLAELHPLFLTNSENAVFPVWSPYIATGFGFFYYNPRTKLDGKWVNLRPLRTEGEGFNEYPGRKIYKQTSWCVPVGMGIRYDAAGNYVLRIEILYRITGTDYLDDVSENYIDPGLFYKYLPVTEAVSAARLADRGLEVNGGNLHPTDDKRGNSGNNDSYFSFCLKLTRAFGRTRKPRYYR